MKKLLSFYSLLFLVINFGWAQNSNAVVDGRMAKIPAGSSDSTESIANYIKANFKTDADKIRAVFYWTASNISYDVKNMLTVNFNESVEEKINKTLKTKKGVCIHYAVVFNEIADKLYCAALTYDALAHEFYPEYEDRMGDFFEIWTCYEENRRNEK